MSRRGGVVAGYESSSLTRRLVSDEFTAFEVSYGREERPDVVLGHVRWKIVDDQVGSAVISRLLQLLLLLQVVRASSSYSTSTDDGDGRRCSDEARLEVHVVGRG